MYSDVSEAVEDGLLSDATSRNALYKIHVSLGKIVNSLDEQQLANRRTSRSISHIDRHPTEDRTVLEEPDIKEEDFEDSDAGTVVLEQGKASAVANAQSDNEDVKMNGL